MGKKIHKGKKSYALRDPIPTEGLDLCNATSLYIYLHNSENLRDVPILGGNKEINSVVKSSA